MPTAETFVNGFLDLGG